MIPEIKLTNRQLCDLELLLIGAFHPVTTFMDAVTYSNVVYCSRYSVNNIFPIPIVLDVDEDTARSYADAGKLILKDNEGLILAELTADAESCWYRLDKKEECKNVYGTLDENHPGVDYILNKTKDCAVYGNIVQKAPIKHDDFSSLRSTPAEVKRTIAQLGIKNVVAFQTRNPLHKAHVHLTKEAARKVDGAVLIHPVVGETKPGDIDHFTRVKCYQAALKEYPKDVTPLLSLLPLAMRMAGPREAILHAIIRKNYGCTHIIIGRDHAGPGNDASGKPYYGPYDAQEAVAVNSADLGIQMVPFKAVGYSKSRGVYVEITDKTDKDDILSISGTEVRRLIKAGQDIPEFFTFKSVSDILKKANKNGKVIFFTGLSGSGKSTIAKLLCARIKETTFNDVTLLDGDIVRDNLSAGLGFSKEHRDLNIRRIGFVAAEIARHGGVVICSAIAPYDDARQYARKLAEEAGAEFILAYVLTPLEVCEKRDCKGLYAKARAGVIKEFTGISDPYEVPKNAEIYIDTTDAGDVENENIIKNILNLF